MLKIATHDSATGEKGGGFLSWLVTPFSKTQTKTLKEQFDAGCRMFDIRIKDYKDAWYCAHGLWRSHEFASLLLFGLDKRAQKSVRKTFVSVTYEGKAEKNDLFLEFCHWLMGIFPHLTFTYFAVKYGKDSTGVKVKYDILEKHNMLGGTQGFLPLDGRSWHTYLPIPWLWDRLYKRPHKFNGDTFTFVDFL